MLTAGRPSGVVADGAGDVALIVGDETRGNRNPRRIFLVGARVGVVRDDGRDARGRGAARRVEHQQQFDQMFLHRWDQRLDDEHVGFPAAGAKLHAHAIVAETADRRRAERRLQSFADIARERLVGTSAEDNDPVHARQILRG
jgi:hypothetical protein